MINQNPVISIIVPIYNVEKYLSRCLESLIMQSFTDIEIICIIDGSLDRSKEICENYKKKDNRIIIITQSNMGVSAARNTGLENATGIYIQFCDPDDYYTPDMCKKMYDTITASDVDIVSTGTNIIYDQVDIIRGDHEYFRVKGSGKNIINNEVIKNIDVSLWNKIFKKSIIDAYYIRFPKGLVYEDAAFIYKYLFTTRSMFYLSEYLYNYVRHENSIMSNTYKKSNNSIDHVKILEDIKLFLIKNNFWNNNNIEIFIWLAITYFHTSIKFGIKHNDELAKQIIYNLFLDVSDNKIIVCSYISIKEKIELLNIKYNNNLKILILFIIYSHYIVKSIIKKILVKFFL